jgi:hypothetical protein
MKTLKEKISIFKVMLMLCEESLKEIWNGKDDDWWGD